ncbi:aryl-sulfate sulfotransferase [Allomuricauda sp. F6463D]|uniref:aryl-sulfate sulfotransferase n=1 Tax=Allomuricauda sp. F6463D TaxID=2926409 RepID=UPI001FF3970F|nr:aryl-sulfate sulfotransferase [Muricauda sp. F6463D]MCK0160643.1 aryl-sulfate sulfotransferase [Muricauda sp. F6463D]
MLKHLFGKFFIFFVYIPLLLSCSNDDNTGSMQDPEEYVEEPEENNTEQEVIKGDKGSVTYYNKDLVQDGYILVNDPQNVAVYLMDKNADVIFEWDLGDRKIGNDVVLQDDGSLLASLRYNTSEDILFGGYGGQIQIMDKEGTALWDFTYATSEHRTHHDLERLPNGNVLAIVWEKIPQTEATEKGSTHNMDLYLESIIEIDPNTDDIIWEWHSIDHIVQDVDDTKLNFGSILENPQLININFNSNDTGNLMHINGIDYDASNDLIYLSVNYYSEVWVIDHSTTTTSAASHIGGNFDRGGDLVYRFGNPSAYNDQETERIFRNNHHPNLFEPGKLLIFSNGGDLEQSTVYEMQLPHALDQQSVPPNTAPEILWSFTDTELYSDRVSGAVRLPNGNTLITEGDYGIWEVTEDGEVVWKFSGTGFFWRSYYYSKNHPGVKALGL